MNWRAGVACTCSNCQWETRRESDINTNEWRPAQIQKQPITDQHSNTRARKEKAGANKWRTHQKATSVPVQLLQPEPLPERRPNHMSSLLSLICTPPLYTQPESSVRKLVQRNSKQKNCPATASRVALQDREKPPVSATPARPAPRDVRISTRSAVTVVKSAPPSHGCSPIHAAATPASLHDAPQVPQQTSLDDLGMALIIGLVVILATSFAASPLDNNDPFLSPSSHPSSLTPAPTDITKAKTITTPPAELLTKSSNDSQANSSFNTTTPTLIPTQQSNTSDNASSNVTTSTTSQTATTMSSSLPVTPTTLTPNTTSAINTTTPTSTITSTNTPPPTTLPSTSILPSTVTTPNTNTPTNSSGPISPSSPLQPSSISPTTTSATSSTTNSPQTTTLPTPPPRHHTGTSIALTLFILLAVILLIGAGVWWVRRRRQLERLRHQLMPMYNFDPTDDLDDWENQLLEEERSLRPEADKVQLYSGNATFEAAQKTTHNDTNSKE